jgi:SAM-dependent methyltransferase
MARIDYSDAAAAAFQASRELPPDALSEWRAAIARHLAPRPGIRVLVLGAGTGTWATALANWYGISVVAVEPSAAMRARSRRMGTLAGHAAALPLAPATMDGAWLSTVIHHLPDLPAAARALRRVLRPGAPVLIRSASPAATTASGCSATGPRPSQLWAPFPTVAGVRTAFAAAGFSYVTLEQVRQVTAPSLAALAAATRREAHTPLMLITDSAYQAGLARLRAAATPLGPVTDTLDLLVSGSAAPPQPRSPSLSNFRETQAACHRTGARADGPRCATAGRDYAIRAGFRLGAGHRRVVGGLPGLRAGGREKLPRPRWKTIAAGTVGTTLPGSGPTGLPRPAPASLAIAPSAAASPNALPPPRTIACTRSAEFRGSSRSVSRVPGPGAAHIDACGRPGARVTITVVPVRQPPPCRGGVADPQPRVGEAVSRT